MKAGTDNKQNAGAEAANTPQQYEQYRIGWNTMTLDERLEKRDSEKTIDEQWKEIFLEV